MKLKRLIFKGMTVLSWEKGSNSSKITVSLETKKSATQFLT